MHELVFALIVALPVAFLLGCLFGERSRTTITYCECDHASSFHDGDSCHAIVEHPFQHKVLKCPCRMFTPQLEK